MIRRIRIFVSKAWDCTLHLHVLKHSHNKQNQGSESTTLGAFTKLNLRPNKRFEKERGGHDSPMGILRPVREPLEGCSAESRNRIRGKPNQFSGKPVRSNIPTSAQHCAQPARGCNAVLFSSFPVRTRSDLRYTPKPALLYVDGAGMAALALGVWIPWSVHSTSSGPKITGLNGRASSRSILGRRKRPFCRLSFPVRHRP